MMEIQIIQESDDADAVDDVTFQENNRHSPLILSPSNSQGRKSPDDISVASYMLSTDAENEVVDAYMDQADASSNGISDIFDTIDRAQNKEGISGMNSKSDDECEISSNFPKDILQRFVIDAKGVRPSMHVLDDTNSVNSLMNIDDQDTYSDQNFGSTKDDGAAGKQRFVIFSSGNQGASSMVTMAKTNSQLSLNMDTENQDGSYTNMPGTSSINSVESLEKISSNEDVGLDMIFEVVGEVTAPNGQVFMREIMTQTHPPQKQKTPKKKQKNIDAYAIAVNEANSNDSDSSFAADEKRFKCESCSLKFVSEETRNVHQQCHKGSMKDYYCYFCNFTSSQWTKMHLLLFSHGVEKPHKCTQCSFSCRNKSDLKSHMAVHSDKKNFQCPKCHRYYKHRRNVVAHLRSCRGIDANGKPQKMEGTEKFICKVCQRQLSTKKNLDKHMEIHSDRKPFVCKICGHATRLKESLIMHVRLHTGEKPYKCSFCNYATPDKSSLRRHKKTHTKEKPHKCDFCSYSCIQKHCLDTHVRRKHTGEQFICGVCHYTTHDRYGLNQHFKRHQNSKDNTETVVLGLSPDSGPKPIETNKENSAQQNSVENPVVLDIRSKADPQTGDSTEKNGQSISDNSSQSLSNEDKAENTSIELGQLEATLIQQIQQPGDEVYVQTTGEIVIKRPDGHLLVIQRRSCEENEANFESSDNNESNFLAVLRLEDVSQLPNGISTVTEPSSSKQSGISNQDIS